MKTLFLLILLVSTAFAGGDRAGNGGSGIEADIAAQEAQIQNVALKIRLFFIKHNQTLSKVFPEFSIDDFLKKIEKTEFKIVTDEVLLDRHGEKRTCLNFASENKVECSLIKIKEIISSPTAIFVLTFHELLGIIGVEETAPTNPHFIEGYKISKRISPYVTEVSNYDLVLKKEDELASRIAHAKEYQLMNTNEKECAPLLYVSTNDEGDKDIVNPKTTDEISETSRIDNSGFKSCESVGVTWSRRDVSSCIWSARKMANTFYKHVRILNMNSTVTEYKYTYIFDDYKNTMDIKTYYKSDEIFKLLPTIKRKTCHYQVVLPENIQFEAEVSRAQNEVLMCARSMVKKASKIDLNLLYLRGYLDDLLVKMKAAGTSVSELKRLSEDCYNQDIRVFQGDSREKFIYSNLVSDLIFPEIMCQETKVSVRIAALIGLSAGASVAKCQASDGSRFLAVSPHLGFNIGAGATLNFDRTNYTFLEDSATSRRGSFEFSSALIKGYSEGNSGDSYKETGVAIGLGRLGGAAFSLDIKVLPLKDNFDSIIKQIMK